MSADVDKRANTTRSVLFHRAAGAVIPESASIPAEVEFSCDGDDYSVTITDRYVDYEGGVNVSYRIVHTLSMSTRTVRQDPPRPR